MTRPTWELQTAIHGPATIHLLSHNTQATSKYGCIHRHPFRKHLAEGWNASLSIPVPIRHANNLDPVSLGKVSMMRVKRKSRNSRERKRQRTTVQPSRSLTACIVVGLNSTGLSFRNHCKDKADSSKMKGEKLPKIVIIVFFLRRPSREIHEKQRKRKPPICASDPTGTDTYIQPLDPPFITIFPGCPFLINRAKISRGIASQLGSVENDWYGPYEQNTRLGLFRHFCCFLPPGPPQA